MSNELKVVTTAFATEKNATFQPVNVYNRWGDLILEVRDIMDNQPIWDGRFKNVDAPAGVYVYQIRYKLEDGTTGYLKGDVTVYR